LSRPGRPELVIFDCDGVLVDSEVIACRVLSESLAEAGILVTADDIAENYVGLSAATIFADIERRTGRRVPEDFAPSTRPRLEAAFAAELAAMPPDDRSRALAAADVVASWESVDLLRHDQSLDRAAAGAVVAHGLRALFGGRP
jgi:beta-phosphoglucomutase-like phosphatase (HAD superfamily)